MEVIFSKDEINKTAFSLWQNFYGKKIWALHGEMGSGKTTFIHALCDMLGVTSAIGSPTYAIINEYSSPQVGTIYHMDCYRLKNEEEAYQAGLDDLLYSKAYCFIEWPERIQGLLTADTLLIHLSVIDNDLRKIITI